MVKQADVMEHPIALDGLLKDEMLKSVEDFPKNLRSEYASKHFVLVDGFFNEGARLACLYFKDNINQLKELGFTCSQLRYRSTRSLFRNAESLHRDILAKFFKYKKPIVLIGHSMGGGEALCLVLQHPELMIDNVIDKVGWGSLRGLVVMLAHRSSPIAAGNTQFPLRQSLLTRTTGLENHGQTGPLASPYTQRAPSGANALLPPLLSSAVRGAHVHHSQHSPNNPMRQPR